MASGFELDIITIVLLGGVRIFGGAGPMIGVALAILIVLNIRNGLGLAGVNGTTQIGVIGVILIPRSSSRTSSTGSATASAPLGTTPAAAATMHRPTDKPRQAGTNST